MRYKKIWSLIGRWRAWSATARAHLDAYTSREKTFWRPNRETTPFRLRKTTIKQSPAENPTFPQLPPKTVNYPSPLTFPSLLRRTQTPHLCRAAVSGGGFRRFLVQKTTNHATISLHLLTGELPRRIALFPTSPPSSPDPPRSPTFGPPPPPLIRLFRRRRKGKRLLFSVLIRFRKPLLHPLSWFLPLLHSSRLGLRFFLIANPRFLLYQKMRNN